MQDVTQNAEETQALARKWLREHKDQKIWLLKGDLGAGKTCFVKGIAEHFNEDPIKVKSPTFALIEEHATWIHVDLYRLESRDEILEEELKEYMKAGYTLFVEWPERLDLWKNRERAEVTITHLGGDTRGLTLSLLP